MKVTRIKNKTQGEAKLTVDIRFGPATPAQSASWRRFWAKVMSEVNEEIRREQQRDHRSKSPESSAPATNTAGAGGNDNNSTADMPSYPHEPCEICGGTDFWPDFRSKRFICSRCHPKLGGGNGQ